MQYLLGYDIGSSSVKASLIEIKSGECVGTDYQPRVEAPMISLQTGWAEQDPTQWWTYLQEATHQLLQKSGVHGAAIKAVGISYQMHGLVLLDKHGEVLRPSIIWCDSRAVDYGKNAFSSLGEQFSLSHLLNSPGNFTAAKLAWVKANEPAIYERIDKVMLPGDYIAYRLTGQMSTTISGLSEGIFWDFQRNELSEELMNYWGFDKRMIAQIVPTFGDQGRITAMAAQTLGLQEGTPLCYRAGDQPNNALSLNVLNPGEVASTAGTSGVVYGVNSHINYDPRSRVNNFAHVNHTAENPRLGILLCINGTGILNSWCKRMISPELSYDEMNRIAAQAPIGAEGLTMIPFGNGAERILENQNIGASIQGLSFNQHDRRHLLRAAQEGIVFSFVYGMEIMKEMGMQLSTIRAGNANMFMSPLFRETLASTSDATIELYDTDGSIGAARGAGIGAGIYQSPEEALEKLQRMMIIHPDQSNAKAYKEAYAEWKKRLQSIIHN